MAEQNPTGGTRIVPLPITPRQTLILSSLAGHWQEGFETDLENADRLDYPDECRRKAAINQRLLDALTLGFIHLPDDEVKAAVAEAAKAHDEATDFATVLAEHDALYALLACLDPDWGAEWRRRRELGQ